MVSWKEAKWNERIMTCMKGHESIETKELKWRNWHEWIEPNELAWMNWNERIEMKELKLRRWKEWLDMKWKKWMNWKEWLEMNDLTWWNGSAWMERMNWHELQLLDMNELIWMHWHEGIDMKELKRMNWHEGIDMKDLKRMNWNEGSGMTWMKWMNWHEWNDMNELTWRTWHEWFEWPKWNELKKGSDMKELKPRNWHEWMIWHERIEMNDLRCMNWREWSAKSSRTPSFFYEFYLKPSSRYSLVHMLSTSSSKSVPSPSVFFTISMWSGALATVSSTFCQPHLPKVFRARQFFLRFLCEAELSPQSQAHFANLIFQKCSEPVSFFYDFYVKQSSRHSLKHILSTSSSKSVPSPSDFFTISMWSGALATVSSTFCQPHLPKVFRARQFFFTISMWSGAFATVSSTFCQPHLPKVFRARQIFLRFLCENGALATVSSTFCRPLCRIEARNCGNRDLPAATTFIYPKKTQDFAPENVYKCEFTRSRSLTCPNYIWWWCDWHDDVVDMMIDMMMWLPWWWDS